jgi:hypothetical protein
MQDPISKAARAKRMGDMNQVVEPLPSKHITLNSKQSIKKKNSALRMHACNTVQKKQFWKYQNI